MTQPAPGHGALAALAGGILGLAFSPLLVRMSEIGPSATAVQRVLLAMPVLAVWMLVEQRGLGALTAISRRDWLTLILAGLFWTGDLVAWHWGLKLTSIANASLLTMTGPIFVTLGSWLLFNEQVSRGFLFGLIIALAGAAPLVAASVELSADHLLGDAIAVSAAGFFAAYLLAIKQLRGGLPTGTIMCLTCLFSLPGLFAAAWLSGEPLAASTLRGWLIVLALALSAQAFGQALIALAMSRLPAPFTSVALLVQPFLAITLGWMILGEAATALQFLGGFVVLVGILVSRRYGMRRPAPGSSR
ncbi:MAG TPA: DMT family transporter [Candidatus Angelobacter sp.]|nr:DMT family transporter [Candidatus Angelobacter sp.]